MSERPVRLEVHGGVALLTLDRPDIRNAITDDIVAEAVEALTNPPENVVVLIITGEGRAFSAGGNVHEMANRQGMFAGTPNEISEQYRRSIQRLTRAVLTTDLVTVAAVNGPAVGAGFDLVLGCDLRLGVPGAWFAHTFVDLGIIPGDGGAWILPRVVGFQRAAELAFTARRVSAEEAVELDILLEVVDEHGLIERCRELADEIASKPSHSIRLTKRLFRHARTMDLDGFLDLSAALQALSHAEPAHANAVDAYLKNLKRKS